MSTYEYYACPNPDEWQGGVRFNDYVSAKNLAGSMGWCVVEVAFDYSGSELVDDLRWKPRKEMK